MIWLIGAEGMLGHDVASLLRSRDLPFIATDKETDIRDRNVLLGFALRARSEPVRWVVNCSGYTAVDQAEDEPDAAFGINATGVGNIAEASRRLGASLIHISTDYVFDGSKDGAYTEKDAPSPLGVYGKSKLDGERAVLDRAETTGAVIRTSWLYGAHGGNFVKTMLRLFQTKDELKVVSDQWGSPTYTRDLAGAILAVLASDPRPVSVYHFCNRGKTCWYEFAREIRRLALKREIIHRETMIRPVSTAEYPTKAARPRNSLLSTDKIRAAFGVTVRPWRDALDDFLKELSDAKTH